MPRAKSVRAGGRPPRPPNAFLLYLADFCEKAKVQDPSPNKGDPSHSKKNIARQAGIAWRRESLDVVYEYCRRASELLADYERSHPSSSRNSPAVPKAEESGVGLLPHNEPEESPRTDSEAEVDAMSLPSLQDLFETALEDNQGDRPIRDSHGGVLRLASFSPPEDYRDYYTVSSSRSSRLATPQIRSPVSPSGDRGARVPYGQEPSTSSGSPLAQTDELDQSLPFPHKSHPLDTTSSPSSSRYSTPHSQDAEDDMSLARSLGMDVFRLESNQFSWPMPLPRVYPGPRLAPGVGATRSGESSSKPSTIRRGRSARVSQRGGSSTRSHKQAKKHP